MSIYRINAKEDDMIVELNKDEIKLACAMYVINEYNLYKIGNTSDIKINYKPTNKVTIVRIKCKKANI